MRLNKTIQALNDGLGADIFYDAIDHEDWDKANEIEDFQSAVGDAVERLKSTAELIQMLVDVINDFLPNIGNCALQDYGRLNTALIESEKWIKENNE